MQNIYRLGLTVITTVILLAGLIDPVTAICNDAPVPVQLFYINAYWVNLTKERGLGSDHVTALTGDANGRIYAGTRDGGLSIVTPGLSVRTMTEQHGLPSNTVTAVAIAPDGKVWVGTNNGIAVLSEGRVQKVVGREDGLPDNLVTDIEFRGTEVWMATPKGVGLKQPEGWLTYRLVKDMPSDKVLAVCAPDKGNIWAGAFEVIMEKQGDDSWELINSMDAPQVASAWVSDIAANDTGIWFTSVGGVLCLDIFSEEWIYHSLGDETSSNWTTALATSHQEEIWVGTNGTGVVKLAGEETVRFNSKNSRLTNEHITALYIDDERDFLWIGTAGGGLFRYGMMTFVMADITEVILPGPVTCLASSGAGTWVGTPDRGVFLIKDLKVVKELNTITSPIPSDEVRDLDVDRNRRLWIATWGGGVACLDGREWQVFTGVQERSAVKLCYLDLLRSRDR